MTVVTDSSGIISGQSDPQSLLEIIQTQPILLQKPAILSYNEQVFILMDPYYQHSIDNKTSFKLDSHLASHWLELSIPRRPIGPDMKCRRRYVNINIVFLMILFSSNKAG